MTKRKRKPTDVTPELEALYAEVPDLECRGLCADSCGPIDMSEAERRRVAQAGVHIAPREVQPGTLDCPALSTFGTCRVYDVRPMICRLWGTAQSMPCTYGCRPKAGLLPDRDAMDVLARTLIVGGGDMNDYTREMIVRMADDEEAGPLLARYLRGDKSVAAELAGVVHRRQKEDREHEAG
jgi:hypothetical protein